MSTMHEFQLKNMSLAHNHLGPQPSCPTGLLFKQKAGRLLGEFSRKGSGRVVVGARNFSSKAGRLCTSLCKRLEIIQGATKI